MSYEINDDLCTTLNPKKSMGTRRCPRMLVYLFIIAILTFGINRLYYLQSLSILKLACLNETAVIIMSRIICCCC